MRLGGTIRHSLATSGTQRHRRRLVLRRQPWRRLAAVAAVGSHGTKWGVPCQRRQRAAVCERIRCHAELFGTEFGMAPFPRYNVTAVMGPIVPRQAGST